MSFWWHAHCAVLPKGFCEWNHDYREISGLLSPKIPYPISGYGPRERFVAELTAYMFLRQWVLPSLPKYASRVLMLCKILGGKTPQGVPEYVVQKLLWKVWQLNGREIRNITGGVKLALMPDNSIIPTQTAATLLLLPLVLAPSLLNNTL
jgi:hypothetical protein